MFDDCLVDLLFACVVLLTSCSCRQPFIAGIFLLGSGRSIAAGKEGMVHVGRKCGMGTRTKELLQLPLCKHLPPTSRFTWHQAMFM